jgi:hypothetical protein
MAPAGSDRTITHIVEHTRTKARGKRLGTPDPAGAVERIRAARIRRRKRSSPPTCCRSFAGQTVKSPAAARGLRHHS